MMLSVLIMMSIHEASTKIAITEKSVVIKDESYINIQTVTSFL